MLAEIILYFGLASRSLLLLRAYQNKTVTVYKWFYAYICAGLAADVVLYLAIRAHSGHYAEIYWSAQFGTLVLGCGIILEIFKHVLSAYPGAEKFAMLACAATFGAIFLFGVTYAWLSSLTTQATYVQLERDVRSAQIAFMVAIVAVILYYGIALGGNMRGMICGYAAYLFASVVALALGAYLGHRFNAIWRVAQPLSFEFSLFVWLVTLWGYAPNPLPDENIPVGSDYENLAAMTKQRIDTLRSHIGRVARL